MNVIIIKMCFKIKTKNANVISNSIKPFVDRTNRIKLFV